MSLRRAIKYFRYDEKVKRLPRDLVTPFDPTELSDDELIVIRAGAAKDRHGIARLMKLHKAQTAAELLPRLPKRKPPSWRKRLMDFLRRIEGSTEFDPARRRPRTEHSRDGITHTKLRR